MAFFHDMQKKYSMTTRQDNNSLIVEKVAFMYKNTSACQDGSKEVSSTLYRAREQGESLV
jgi:hypothetical protein